ncbi:hypothetical protein [Clostridium beijerinckii]|nr:hypothetical protein [Clostridium beijerinckii]
MIHRRIERLVLVQAARCADRSICGIPTRKSKLMILEMIGGL